MKYKFTFFSLILSFFFLSGCATGPKFEEYASSIPAIPDNAGRIYIYRTATFGAAIQPGIKVNGEVVGKAVPQGFFFVDRPAGSYEVSASTEAKRSLSLNLDAGQERYVRLEVKMGLFAGHIKPVLVDNAEGKDEIKKTKYVGK